MRLCETVPYTTIDRNSVLPEKIAGGGLIILHDGDPGEPEQALGGFGSTYYQHAVEIEVYVEEGDATARDAAFNSLLQQGAALEADPTLGDLAFGLTYSRPEPAIKAIAGAPAIKAATLAVSVDYESDAPLRSCMSSSPTEEMLACARPIGKAGPGRRLRISSQPSRRPTHMWRGHLGRPSRPPPADQLAFGDAILYGENSRVALPQASGAPHHAKISRWSSCSHSRAASSAASTCSILRVRRSPQVRPKPRSGSRRAAAGR